MRQYLGEDFFAMKNKHPQIFLVLSFILAQLAWLALLGLWIYWYVSNNIIFQQVGNKLAPQVIIESPNVFIFVGGLILITAIAFIMNLIFRNLTVQIKVTKLYDNFICQYYSRTKISVIFNSALLRNSFI